jgi:hypothetical protein
MPFLDLYVFKDAIAGLVANKIGLPKAFFKEPRLVLVDSLYPLCDKGPQPDPKYKWAYSGLIAGTDPVAVETVCLKIITEKRKGIRGEPWPLSPPPICV